MQGDPKMEETTACALASRYAVLAVGSNACPARLADQDKFGGHPAVVIPVLRGFVEGLVSVYAPRMADYGSVPSTVMVLQGATSELWLTRLSEEELFRMDKSEGRGSTYDLVELPDCRFHMNGGVTISPISEYYQPEALRHPGTETPILLDCFRVTGATLTSMGQEDGGRLVDRITRGFTDREQPHIHPIRDHSLRTQLPGSACTLERRSAPSRYSVLNETESP